MKHKLCILLLWSLPAWLRAEAPSAIAIHNARVVTGSGPTLEKGTVVLRNGLIEAVGENVAIPPDAWVVEAQGLTVYPGLVDALSTIGLPETTPPTGALGAGRGSGTPAVTRGVTTPPATPAAPPARGPEDRPQTNSWVRAADLVSATERRIDEARSNGFTSAVSFPATGIFAGQGAWLNLGGEKNQMVMTPEAGQYVTFPSGGFGGGGGGGFPSSLMGVISYVRQLYLDAGYYKLQKAAYDSHAAGVKRPAYDRAVEGLLESPRVLLPASSAVQLARMVRFAPELKAPAVLYGAHEAYRVADVLAGSHMPVLVSLKWPERARDADPDEQESLRVLELRERAPGAPAALAKAGVRFAFYSDGAAPRDLRRAVKRAIDAGLSEADAVRALTLSAAEIYGLGDRLGSIEKGKIANLVVSQGNLFDTNSKIQYVFVDGVKYLPSPETPIPGGPAPTNLEGDVQ